MRIESVIAGCVVLAVGLLIQSAATADVARPSNTEIEQAVIASIPAWHGRKATILKYLDLTQPFATKSPWALVVAQDARPAPADLSMMGNAGPIAVCFVKGLTPGCTEARGHAGDDWFDMANGLRAAAVVFAGSGQPLLMLQTLSAHGMNGNANFETKLFRYDRKTDDFRPVFVNVNGGTNNNAATRFVEHGPLQGDVIIDHPTSDAPYAYWIEVYAPGKSGLYARILRYRSITHYGDGNPLPVADSEMPEIMKRLGFWKPGDALPLPPHAPSGCAPFVMRHGEEWCKTDRIASSPQQ